MNSPLKTFLRDTVNLKHCDTTYSDSRSHASTVVLEINVYTAIFSQIKASKFVHFGRVHWRHYLT